MSFIYEQKSRSMKTLLLNAHIITEINFWKQKVTDQSGYSSCILEVLCLHLKLHFNKLDVKYEKICPVSSLKICRSLNLTTFSVLLTMSRNDVVTLTSPSSELIQWWTQYFTITPSSLQTTITYKMKGVAIGEHVFVNNTQCNKNRRVLV